MWGNSGKSWQARHRALSLRWLMVVSFGGLFVGTITLLVWVLTFGIPFTSVAGSYGIARQEAIRELTVIADLKKEALHLWLVERKRDALAPAPCPFLQKTVLHVGEGTGESCSICLVDQYVRPVNASLQPSVESCAMGRPETNAGGYPADLAVRGQEGSVETSDALGEPIFAVYRSLEVSPGVFWGLVVTRKRSEVLRPVYGGLMSSAPISLLAIAGAGLVALLVAGRIARPILGLSQVAGAVEAGDLTARARVRGTGEVAALASTFNKMIRKVQHWNSDLADQVQARTGDLASANKRLAAEITAHWESEQALRKSESSLLMAQRIAGLGSWDWNIVGNELTWSEEIYRIFGLLPSGFGATYESFLQAVHPEDRQSVVVAVDRALKLHESYIIGHRVVRPDGEIRFVHEEGVVTFDATGQPVRMVGTVHDITETKQVQDALERSNRLLKSLSEAQMRVISDSDEQDVLSKLLETLVSLTDSQYGYIGELLHDATGQPFLQTRAFTRMEWDKKTLSLYEKYVAQGLKIQGFNNLIGAVVTSASPVISEHPVLDPRSGGLPPGHPPIASYLGLPLRIGGQVKGVAAVANRADGYDQAMVEFLEPYLATCSQILEAFRREKLRKEAEEALKASEERMRLVIEGAPIGIQFAQEGRFRYVNPAFVTMFGYDRPEEIVGNAIESLYLPEDRSLIKRQETLRREPEALPAHHECKGLKKGGPPFDVTVRLKVIDFKGESAVLGFVVDVSEEKKLRAQLIQAQKLEALGTLAGGIAHDFNNILFGVSGFTELAMDYVEPGSRELRHLQRVLDATGRAKEMVQHILTFSRQNEPQRKPVLLGSLVKEGLKFLRASIPTTIEMRQRISDGRRMVLGDPTQIHQVLMNLCTNAAHAIGDQPGTLSIELHDAEVDEETARLHPDLEPGKYVRLSVGDTGHGLPADVQERIFDPYFTTKKAGEGTGLGLSVVHGIIKSHGGAIKVYSEVKKGSTFVVYLPVLDDRGEHRASGDIVETIPRGTERILFVDDEQVVADLGKEMLEPLGYEVTATTSSMAALAMFSAAPDDFDLIITDFTMPVMTGIDLAKQAREIRPDVPIICCTGFSQSVTDEQVMSIGINDLIMKPILRRDIAKAVRRVLDEKST